MAVAHVADPPSICVGLRYIAAAACNVSRTDVTEDAGQPSSRATDAPVQCCGGRFVGTSVAGGSRRRSSITRRWGASSALIARTTRRSSSITAESVAVLARTRANNFSFASTAVAAEPCRAAAISPAAWGLRVSASTNSSSERPDIVAASPTTAAVCASMCSCHRLDSACTASTDHWAKPAPTKAPAGPPRRAPPAVKAALSAIPLS